jgi:hypothetical protein
MEEMLKEAQGKQTPLAKRLELTKVPGYTISRTEVATQAVIRTRATYEDVRGRAGRDDARPCEAGYPARSDYD